MKPETLKRLLNLAIGFGLAAVLLWLFLKDADWASVGASIAGANLWLLAAAMAGHVASLLIRTWRWRLLLHPVKADIPYGPIWKFFNIGFAVTSLLPGRIGELLRPYLLARDQGIRFTSSFATVVTERVVDLVAVLVMFGTIFIFPGALGPQPDHPMIGVLKAVGLGALLVALAAVLFLVLLKVRLGTALRLVRFLTKPLPAKVSEKIAGMVQAFADGVGGLRGWRQVGGLIGATAVNWFVVALSFWVALIAFGIEPPPHHTFFLLAVVALGVVVPTPAGTGTYHGAVVLVLATLWGFPYNTTVSYAIVNHIITFSPVVAFGVSYLLRGDINIFAAAEKAGARNAQENQQ